MSSGRTDVNAMLGSWGPQPPEKPYGAKRVTAESLLTPQDWREMGERRMAYAQDLLTRGKTRMAATVQAQALELLHRAEGH